MANDINPSYLIPAGSPASTSVAGTWFDLGSLTYCSIQVAFTGVDVAGTLTLEASVDTVTPITVTGSSQTVAASAPAMWNISGIGYRYIRPRWAYTSGTGTIGAQIFVKKV